MKYKNNPFNIRYDGRSHWLGLIGNKNGFCEFESLYYGVRVCVYLLEKSYPRRGIYTIKDIIHTFAPASDGNNPDGYVDYVCRHADSISKFSYFTLLHLSLKIKVLQAMASMETGVFLDDEFIKRVYSKF